MERHRAARAAAAAATPKISTGMVSGSTSTAISRPPRRRRAVSAAPIAPIMVRAGVPASSEAATPASADGSSPSIRPNSGAATMSGKAVSRPMRGAFDQHHEFERQRAHGETGRASRRRGRPGTAGRGRAGWRAAPRSTGSPARCRASRLRSGPSANGMMATRIEEEHRARAAAAADAPGDAPFAQEERRGEQASLIRRAPARALTAGAASRRSSCASASPSGACVAATIMPPLAQMVAPSPAASASCAAASSAVVGSSSSHSGRGATSRRASATRRFCPAESSRPGNRRSHGRGRPVQRRAATGLARSSPPSMPRPEARFSPPVSAAFKPSAWPR